jgi:hypothetical protein
MNSENPREGFADCVVACSTSGALNVHIYDIKKPKDYRSIVYMHKA